VSVADQIVRATEVVDRQGFNGILFGFSGAGKTTLASTAQNSEYGRDVLFLDFESGTRSIADREDVHLIPVKEFEQTPEIYRYLKDGTHPYRTIVIDSLTELQAVSLKSVMKASATPEQPSQPEYGRSNINVITTVRNFRLLATERGWNVIYICGAVEVKDEVSGAVLTRVDLTPGAAKQVFQAVDVVGYLGVDTARDGTSKRYLLMRNTSHILAKIRQPRTGPQLDTRIEDPTMEAILAHTHARGGVTANASQH
jgi:hypothetical protein